MSDEMRMFVYGYIYGIERDVVVVYFEGSRKTSINLD
jgi:hypothetical protein